MGSATCHVLFGLQPGSNFANLKCPDMSSCHRSGWGSRDTGDARTQDVRNIQGREADLQDREAKATARCLLEMQIPGLRPDLQDPCLGFPVISQEI